MRFVAFCKRLIIMLYKGVVKGMQEMTEKERKDSQMATLYELRLMFTQSEKEQYTKQEIVELLDKIAIAKE